MSRIAKLVGSAALVLGGIGALPAVASAKPDHAKPDHARPDHVKPEKVAICHREARTGTWKLLSVSANAVAAHERHGDAAPGDPVPGQDGMVFDEACVPTQDGLCYESTFDDGFDLWFRDFTDFEFRQSFDGTCTPPPATFPVQFVAIVEAEDQDGATARCADLDADLGFHMRAAYPVPDTWWTCIQ